MLLERETPQVKIMMVMVVDNWLVMKIIIIIIIIITRIVGIKSEQPPQKKLTKQFAQLCQSTNPAATSENSRKGL